MKAKILAVSVLMIFNSCENILDVTSESSISEQVYWQYEQDFDTYLYGIYSIYRDNMNDWTFGEERSESFVQGYNAKFSYWSQNITPGITAKWTTYYSTIGHINLLLNKIEPFAFVRESDKNRIKAEAYALRASLYFYISKIWGDIPLVLEPVEDENVSLYLRTDVAEVFVRINEDINQSLALFPESGFVDKYQFSKPAVYALLADVKLWSAKVLGGGEPDFNAAIDAISEIETSGVSLLDNFGDISDTRKNDEIIFSLYFNRDETGITGSKVHYAFPREDTSGNADNANELAIQKVGQCGYAVSPQVRALFAGYPQDKRISRTYIAELYNGVALYYWPNKFRGTVYTDDRAADDDIIIYRLADMLLLKAEAYAALNQPENALIYLNKVRERAEIPDYTETTKTLLEKEILDERGRELFHENKRWWDLVRAHHAGVIDVYEFVPNLVGKATPLYWPVATSVLSLNSNLVQTEGY